MDHPPPVIGILCIDQAHKLKEKFKTSHSYICSKYCKLFESASARVVPIWIERDESYYRNIMKHINGVIFPGGAVFFDSADNAGTGYTNSYVVATKVVIQIAREMFDVGTYFPLLGICLGFQFLLNHSAGGDVRVPCEKMSKAMNAILEEDFKSSKMFEKLSEDLQMKMLTTKFAPHSHKYCITKEQILLHGIADQWKVTATNKDVNDIEFISTVEHTKYPFYGTQFHPERCAEDAQWFVEYIVDFFISECNKNMNRFKSEADMNRHLIGNFELTCTGCDDVVKHCYIFDKETDYPALDC